MTIATRGTFTDLLSWERARPVGNVEKALAEEGRVQIWWRVPSGLEEEAKDWLKANRSVISSGFQTPFHEFSGKYRAVAIEAAHAAYGKSASVTITLAVGYYTAYSTWGSGSPFVVSTTSPWYTATYEQIRYSESGGTTLSVNSNTYASVDPSKLYKVTFRGIHPDYAVAVVNGMSGNTFTDPYVGGTKLTGTWYAISAVTSREEDESVTIVLTIASNRLCLKSYSDAGGKNEQDVYYLWNVAKSEAQTILDDFKAEYPNGSYATVDYWQDSEVCGFILRCITTNDTVTVQAGDPLADSYADINGVLLRVDEPNTDTEARTFGWFNVAGAAKDTAMAILDDWRDASDQWVSANVEAREHDGLYDIRFTITKYKVSADVIVTSYSTLSGSGHYVGSTDTQRYDDYGLQLHFVVKNVLYTEVDVLVAALDKWTDATNGYACIDVVGGTEQPVADVRFTLIYLNKTAPDSGSGRVFSDVNPGKAVVREVTLEYPYIQNSVVSTAVNNLQSAPGSGAYSTWTVVKVDIRRTPNGYADLYQTFSQKSFAFASAIPFSYDAWAELKTENTAIVKIGSLYSYTANTYTRTIKVQTTKQKVSAVGSDTPTVTGTDVGKEYGVFTRYYYKHEEDGNIYKYVETKTVADWTITT